MGSFLEYAPIGAILLNENEYIVNYNQQARKLFSSLKFAEENLASLFSKQEVESIKVFIHDGHNPEERKELPLQGKILLLTSTEVYNEEGHKHFLLLFTDVTNERLEKQRIQTILEALPQMAWTTDKDGLATYFTQGWYFYTGQTKEQPLGLGWTSVIFVDDWEGLAEEWKNCLQTGKPFQQAARYRNNKGEYRWHLARASAIRNNSQEIIMWVGTCTDIHDQILLTEELERKVQERTRSLEVSNSELEQFAHVSSHDLQEPLRKIRTFADLLKENAHVSLDDNSKRYIDKISSTAERMSSSLRALLNFTKLHREEKLVEVNLADVVAHVLIDLELMIAQKGAIVNVNTLPVIKAIPIQMQQLFYNLINNAVKFSKKDTTPTIELTSRLLPEDELIQYPKLNRFKEYYQILVKDNGIGFEQMHAEKIFTIFQRLQDRTEYAGTGIGLSLVKKVVSNHGGEIYARSQPGEGATFHLILPAT
jgi:PAS domain S-box-containing protein